ncbi:hypothetical protein BpHYR1_028457 [Brachionus plicatilis]|uniref:Uncharacterized protein n=1 Tax=Brachionus plicatilis TaxID=10195 RepID=A0A3M7RFZ7_BRAPC|nr:hypothetical protein BpHYR1_028457 [Brachionus plicatilis]
MLEKYLTLELKNYQLISRFYDSSHQDLFIFQTEIKFYYDLQKFFRNELLVAVYLLRQRYFNNNSKFKYLENISSLIFVLYVLILVENHPCPKN